MALYTRGFSHFVASMTAPVASGWSDSCRVGLAPTEKTPPYHGAHPSRTFEAADAGHCHCRAVASGQPSNVLLLGNPVERRLAAILAADVVSYSRLMGADEAGALATLNRRSLKL